MPGMCTKLLNYFLLPKSLGQLLGNARNKMGLGSGWDYYFTETVFFKTCLDISKASKRKFEDRDHSCA